MSLPGQRRARGRGECLSRHSTGRAPHGPGTRASARSTAAACTRSRVRGLTSTGRNVNLSPRTRETEARADGQEPARSAAGAGATSHTHTAGQGHLRVPRTPSARGSRHATSDIFPERLWARASRAGWGVSQARAGAAAVPAGLGAPSASGGLSKVPGSSTLPVGPHGLTRLRRDHLFRRPPTRAPPARDPRVLTVAVNMPPPKTERWPRRSLR